MATFEHYLPKKTGKNYVKNSQYSASFIFTLHLVEEWQRHPAGDLRGYKLLLQFTIFNSNKSVNCFYLKNEGYPIFS